MATRRAASDLNDLPGHLMRRLQQIAVGIFLDETADSAITPVQFALLFAASREPGMDQRTLAARIGFDTSTIGAVLDRLEERGIVRCSASPTDRRVRLLTVTREGEALLDGAMPAMRRAQKRMLAPLPPADRERFVEMMRILVESNHAWSRAARNA